MKRPGVISWSILFGQPDMLSRYLLLYDELWVPWLKSSYPDQVAIEEWDLDESHLAAISYLEQEGLVKEPPIDIRAADADRITTSLGRLYDSQLRKADKTYRTAERAARETAAAQFNMDIALSRLTTYVSWRDRQELVFPVVFPFGTVEAIPKQLAHTHTVLSIVVNHLPAPPDDLPLEDLVAFKKDKDTQYKFARFWHWTQQMVAKDKTEHELVEEIDWLMTDYSHHLEQLAKEQSSERLEVLVVTPLEVLEDLVKIKWGKLASAFFALRRKKVTAHNAELRLPGSELAYLTSATALLSRRYRRA